MLINYTITGSLEKLSFKVTLLELLDVVRLVHREYLRVCFENLIWIDLNLGAPLGVKPTACQ